MALKLLQSGKLLTRAFQNLHILKSTTDLLPIKHNVTPVLSRNFPTFFTKCKKMSSKQLLFKLICFILSSNC